MVIKNGVLIGQILVEEGLVSHQQLESALKEQQRTEDYICTILVAQGFATEKEVFTVLSRQINVPYISLKDRNIEPHIIHKLPAKLANYYKAVPVELDKDTLIVSMVDPRDIRVLDDMKLLLGLEVKGALSSRPEIEEAIRKYYGVGADTIEKMISGKSATQNVLTQTERIDGAEGLDDDATIIRFVNEILSEAIKDRATDIHLEPYQNELCTRFRIDGVLYPIHTPDTVKYFQSAIVSRIKIMAHLNIAERRLPQDGRIKIKIENREIDLRVSTIPTGFGESVHIRVLSAKSFLELKTLGLLEEDLNTIEQVIHKPHGVIFVTGPTGSGKSTTLYASLAHINSSAVKIITIEDPVEYQLKNVNQIQVNHKIGLDFSTALRHMLRHDPDIMMVGEVRDSETAEIAIRAALTGHLVFSTLHTNDAAGAVTRLLDMGIEPFLVSSSLECLIAQRLVRLVCPKCKVRVEPKKEILDEIKRDAAILPKDATYYEGKGCEDCRFTGYWGRTAIYEIIKMTEPIRELILKRSSSQMIKQKAIAQGMRTLRQDGLRKVAMGLTTFVEVMRVAQQEDVGE
ncbi:MAG: Flp pilus assembly complex ATPase component TadA [Candidatus Omnitrophica bacterium]|nr:Flp pilus assembly complex ATPase component TadA [Candidatus Omnitrophota bacterium]